jgi:hypothetical protein
MATYVKVAGIFKVGPDYFKIVLDKDICAYYKRLYDVATYHTKRTQLPKHGGHVNIVSTKLHKGISLKSVKHLHNVPVSFQVDIEGNYGGFTKGFLNFWLDVNSPLLEKLADSLGLPPKQGRFARFHLTIFNTKNL